MTAQIIRFVRCFFLLILLFSAGMILVCLIPNDALEPQFSKSVAQLEAEEVYPDYLFHSDASILDNFMDSIMVKTCSTSEAYENVFQAAFGNNGYPRYWNGYLMFLRPVMTQFSYQQIRYLNMFLLLTGFCFCFSGIHRKLNAAAAFGFAVSMIACFLVLIAESLQYFSVFMLLFVTVLLILYIPFFQKPSNAALLLFAAGMFTNFIDMLTAPLLTLGIPLILIVCLNSQEKQQVTFREQLLLIIGNSLAWCFGYALCWISKWAIGTLVLGENVFEDALKTAQFRVGGNETYPLDRALMFRLNINTYYFAKGHKPAFLILVCILFLAAILIRRRRESWANFLVPVLLVGTFPYIWFFVFSNHSQLHYFYTYRIQAISLFAVFAALGNAIDWKKKSENVQKPGSLQQN